MFYFLLRKEMWSCDKMYYLGRKTWLLPPASSYHLNKVPQPLQSNFPVFQIKIMILAQFTYDEKINYHKNLGHIKKYYLLEIQSTLSRLKIIIG